jgi:transcriptional regulator with XRE-family HTH domain
LIRSRWVTLQELADTMGLSYQLLQKYETGANRLSVGMLPGVAEPLGVEIVDFFADVGPSSPSRNSLDRLRDECEVWLRRTKSEEALRGMVRVFKALAP